MIERAVITQLIGEHQAGSADGEVDGISKPWHAYGRTAKGSRVRLVVKFVYPEQIPLPGKPAVKFSRISMAVSEVICAILFKRLSVSAPEPYLVTLPSLLAQTIRDETLRTVLSSNSGPHFATAFLENTSDVQAGQKIAKSLKEPAEDILGADNFVLNTDRSGGKPNLRYKHDALYAIDHGCAFQALKMGHDWHYLPITFIEAHACHQTIFRSNSGFKKVFTNWENTVTNDLILDLINSVPKEWNVDPQELKIITAHLMDTMGRLSDVKTHLTTSCPP